MPGGISTRWGAAQRTRGRARIAFASAAAGLVFRSRTRLGSGRETVPDLVWLFLNLGAGAFGGRLWGRRT